MPYTDDELCKRKCADDHSGEYVGNYCNNSITKKFTYPFFIRTRLIVPQSCLPLFAMVEGEGVPLWVNVPTKEIKIYT